MWLIRAASVLLIAALVQIWIVRRPPYFDRPRTVVAHVGIEDHPLHDVLLLLPEVEPLIPHGAQVTVFHPKDGLAHNDHDAYLTAVGLLPHHFVLPPFTANITVPREELIEWVVAVGSPFTHPAYAPVAGFPHGWLYRLRE